MLNKKTVEDISLNGKKVLVRCDFNVPLDENNNITDENRIVGALPTIKYLIKNNAKVVLCSHLGRPKGEVKKEEIYAGRFRDFLNLYGFDGNPQKMAEDYFELLSQGYDAIDGAEKVLQYVKNQGYTVCITTNGMSRTQHRRIDGCGLKQYFD